MKPLSDESKKRLTGYLVECWHEDYPLSSNKAYSCKNCGIIFKRYVPVGYYGGKYLPAIIPNRTFTTPDDMMALKDKMVEKGEWVQFFIIANDKYLKAFTCCTRHGFTNWLINPAIFIPLVDEFLKEKEAT